jgi:SM-20-related protein
LQEKTENITNLIYSKGFAVQESFLSGEEVDLLLNVFDEKRNSLKEAGIGNKEKNLNDSTIRGDKTVWLERGEKESLDKIFYEPIEKIMQALNRRCFLGLNDSEFHFALYEKGTFYKRHKDAFKSDDARKISVVLYLNKNWKKADGGELNLYGEETICVEPKAGTLVVFESNLEHEVLENQKDRVSITGWMKSGKSLF